MTSESEIIKKPGCDSNFSTLMLFRCTRRDRAIQLQQGDLYFGSPQQWIDIEKKGNKGQGDVLEGTFMSAEISDNSSIIRALKINPTIEFFNHRGFVYFRRYSILNIRCLCLYGLHNTAFSKEIKPDGRACYRTKIKKSYFSDFTEYKNREEYKRADYAEQPAVVLINNPYEFFERIRSFLLTLGVKENEIIISPVEYINKYTPMLVNTQPPKELLLKDEAFAEQSEVRIIINSTSSKYLEYMKEHNNTISIGSLADITDIYDYYFDDMEIERIGNKRAMISLPQSKAYQIQDLNYLELEDLLFSILGETVELTGTSCNDSWRNKLKPIIDLFYTKFGIVLDVDDNKNVSMHNVPDELLRQSREKYKHLYKQKQFESDIENLLNKGDYLKAHEKCLDASHDNKLYGAVCFHLGIIYKAQHQYQNAIDSFKKSYSYDYKRIESLDGIA